MHHHDIYLPTFFGLKSPLWQTILGGVALPQKQPPSVPWVVCLSDQDKLFCYVSTPKTWSDNQPTVVLVHGLGGSSQSSYMIRLARKFYQEGLRVVRVNLRGCGVGKSLAQKPCNGGQSDDIADVCQAYKKMNPHSPLRLIGFSLSGNIVLKMLGEYKESAKSFCDQAIAVCPAVDLKQGVLEIVKPENRFFNLYFMFALSKMLKERKKLFPQNELNHTKMPSNLYLFDEYFTAPMGGFKNAEDYYERSSSISLIQNIQVPVKIIYAKDDPLIPSSSLKSITSSDFVQIYRTNYGGHLAFLSWSGLKHGFRWMDKMLIDFLQQS